MEMQLLYYAAAAVVGWLARHWGIGAPSSAPSTPSPGGTPMPPAPHPLLMQALMDLLALLRDLQARLPPAAKP